MGYIILIFEIIFVIIGLVILFTSRHSQKDAVYTVLLTKNSEEYIEGIVRELLKSLKSKANNPHFLIIDINSKDKTSSILKILVKDYNFIETVYLK